MTTPAAHRVLVACGVASVSAFLAWLFWHSDLPAPGQRSDIAQTWYAARAWWAGRNPYLEIGPGLAFEWPWRLYYPFPAILVLLPFAWLPMAIVDPLFIGISTGLLAWALTRSQLQDPRLLVFLSLPFLVAFQASQWAPLLTAAALLPYGAPLLICKPTLGLALLAYQPTLKRVGLVAGFGLVSVLIWPDWLRHWWAVAREADHITAPLLRPGGFLMLTALLAWRMPAARFLLVLSVLPQSWVIYEAVALFLVVTTVNEAALLWLLTTLTFVVHYHWIFAQSDFSPANTYWAGCVVVWLLYLPMTALVLWRHYSPAMRSASVR